MFFWRLNPGPAAPLDTGISSATSAKVFEIRGNLFNWSDQKSARVSEQAVFGPSSTYFCRKKYCSSGSAEPDTVQNLLFITLQYVDGSHTVRCSHLRSKMTGWRIFFILFFLYYLFTPAKYSVHKVVNVCTSWSSVWIWHIYPSPFKKLVEHGKQSVIVAIRMNFFCEHFCASLPFYPEQNLRVDHYLKF